MTRGEKPDISDKRIIYNGHTTGSLHDRLHKFDLSCRSYYGSHAGGQSFFKCKIAPKFKNRREKVRQSDSGRGQVRKKMQEYIERNRGRFETRWEREKFEPCLSALRIHTLGVDCVRKMAGQSILNIVCVCINRIGTV